MTENLNVSDGLTNGARGVVKNITHDSPDAVILVWVLFDDATAGAELRRRSTALYARYSQVQKAWTPVRRQCHKFQLRDRSY